MMGCSELDCGENACCNYCSAELYFATEPGRYDTGIALDGMQCTGDDTGVCCELPVGKPITVTGLLKNDLGRTRLVVSSTCTPK